MVSIKQKDYHDLEVDCQEKDIIQIWMNCKEDSNVIHIERENLQELVNILQKEIK